MIPALYILSKADFFGRHLLNTYSTPATRSLRLIEQLVFSRDFAVQPYKPVDDRPRDPVCYASEEQHERGWIYTGQRGRWKEDKKQNFQECLRVCSEDPGRRDVSSRSS